MTTATAQRDKLDQQAQEIQQQLQRVGESAEVVRTTIQVGVEVAPAVRERYRNFQEGRETRREAERLERTTQIRTEQTGRAGDGEFTSRRVPITPTEQPSPVRLPESNRVAPPPLPTDAPLPSAEDLRRQGQDVFNERRSRATDQRIIDTHNRYIDSGGFEAERQAEAARREAVRQEEIARTAERQRQNAERLGTDYEQRIRQGELDRQIRQLRERELAETAIRESQRRDFERRRQYEADGGIEGERRRAIAEAESRRDLLRDQTVAQQRYEREVLQPRRAAEAREAELLANARRHRQAELAETAARERGRELAASEARRRASDSANNLLNDWRNRQEFGQIQTEQKVRQTAKELGFDVQNRAREAERINRQLPTATPPRPPVTNLESDYLRQRGSGIESFKRPPFDSPPRPEIPVMKPELPARPAPSLSDRFPPLQFKEPPKAKLNFGLDLQPAPDYGENLTRRGIPPTVNRPPVPRMPDLPLPSPTFPASPPANFPIRIPKGIKGNLATDLVFDLIFPDALNEGEDQLLRGLNETLDRFNQGGNSGTNTKFNPDGTVETEFPGNELLIPGRLYEIDLAATLEGYNPNTGRQDPFLEGYTIGSTTLLMAPFSGVKFGFISVVEPSNLPGTRYRGRVSMTVIGTNAGAGTGISTEAHISYFVRLRQDGSVEVGVPIQSPRVTGLRLQPTSSDPNPRNPYDPSKFPRWTFDPGSPTMPIPTPTRPDGTPINPPTPQPEELKERRRIPLPPFQEFRSGRIWVPGDRSFNDLDDDPGVGAGRTPQTQTKPKLQCEGGDCMNCRFNLAQIREVVISELRTQLKQETKIKKWNEEKQEIEDKTAFLFATSETVPAVKDIYRELAELRKEKPVATVPDRFKTRTPDFRPQMCILYRDISLKSTGHYQIVVPWANNVKPSAFQYKKGDRMTIYEMEDSSKIVVNAISQAEGERVIRALLGMIPEPRKKGARWVTTCRSDKLQTITVKPIRADFYKLGMKGSMQPDKRYYFS